MIAPLNYVLGPTANLGWRRAEQTYYGVGGQFPSRVLVAFGEDAGMGGADKEFEGNCKGGSALTTATLESRILRKCIAMFVLRH